MRLDGWGWLLVVLLLIHSGQLSCVTPPNSVQGPVVSYSRCHFSVQSSLRTMAAAEYTLPNRGSCLWKILLFSLTKGRPLWYKRCVGFSGYVEILSSEPGFFRFLPDHPSWA
jgi:hypothetical protein